MPHSIHHNHVNHIFTCTMHILIHSYVNHIFSPISPFFIAKISYMHHFPPPFCWLKHNIFTYIYILHFPNFYWLKLEGQTTLVQSHRLPKPLVHTRSAVRMAWWPCAGVVGGVPYRLLCGLKFIPQGIWWDHLMGSFDDDDDDDDYDDDDDDDDDELWLSSDSMLWCHVHTCYYTIVHHITHDYMMIIMMLMIWTTFTVFQIEMKMTDSTTTYDCQFDRSNSCR